VARFERGLLESGSPDFGQRPHLAGTPRAVPGCGVLAQWASPS
jgi:hypothetical protein